MKTTRELPIESPIVVLRRPLDYGGCGLGFVHIKEVGNKTFWDRARLRSSLVSAFYARRRKFDSSSYVSILARGDFSLLDIPEPQIFFKELVFYRGIVGENHLFSLRDDVTQWLGEIREGPEECQMHTLSRLELPLQMVDSVYSGEKEIIWKNSCSSS